MRKHVHLLAMTLVVLGVSGGALHLRAQTKSPVDEKAAIEDFYKNYDSAFNKKDVNGVMAVFAPNVFVFDALPPRQYPTWAAYKKDWEGLFAAYPGPLTNSFMEMNITVVGSMAYTHYIDDTTFTAKDGSKVHFVVRTTDVLRRSKGKWLIVHEHVSFPVDLATGKADLLSKP
jgi:ketosteroid isomerase-like protein